MAFCGNVLAPYGIAARQCPRAEETPASGLETLLLHLNYYVAYFAAQRGIQPMMTMERYEWLFSMVTWIRTQKELRAQSLFETFVRELGQVLQFDALAKFDPGPNRVEWYLGSGFRDLEKDSK